ncbi:hypothetical protein FFA01_24180 [Frigoribacterium faeni]|uniref:Uncharacterized protein n=1 Tax=Frigoribacterium faeni TaxID=145483 RepID=A0ABQ0URM2_9MICO|nr:hypothetical protein GCM10025699_73190 [Microbacterium flavescens]GEK84109.1 hypothetical protein FFA01_24180 [Frigoribacterium faeni]
MRWVRRGVPCTAPRLVHCTASRAPHRVLGVAPRAVRCNASSPGVLHGTRCGEPGAAADAPHRFSCTASRLVRRIGSRASHRVAGVAPRTVHCAAPSPGALYGTRCGERGGTPHAWLRVPHRIPCTALRRGRRTAWRALHRV